MFRTDAKAEGGTVAIGGWRPMRGSNGVIDLSLSPWFAVHLTPSSAPWAFARGEPFRAVASLELLATVVGLIVFSPEPSGREEMEGIITVTSLTDSMVSTKVLARGLTTSFPLCLVAMEAAAQMEARGLELKLNWVPRDLNEEADSLSNLRFAGFTPRLRVEVDLAELPLLVLPRLTRQAFEFYEVSRRALPASKRKRRGSARQAPLRERDPW